MATIAELEQELIKAGAEIQETHEPCRRCGAQTVEAVVFVNGENMRDEKTFVPLLFQYCEGENQHINLIN